MGIEFGGRKPTNDRVTIGTSSLSEATPSRADKPKSEIAPFNFDNCAINWRDSRYAKEEDILTKATLAEVLTGSDEFSETADVLTRLLTSDPKVRFAFQRLKSTAEIYDNNPEDTKALLRRNEALKRYVDILRERVTPEEDQFSASLGRAAEIVESPDVTPEKTDFVAKGLLLIGVAVLASVSAGALGALIVKEVVYKEVVKTAIGAFVTTTATLATERAWQKTRGGRRTGNASTER
jgi:hypothetical protein